MRKKDYKVDFSIWKQISLNDSSIQRPIKRVADDIPSGPLSHPFSIPRNSMKVKYIYFWRSDADPFSSLRYATWRPYDDEDNLILEEGYQKFLIDENEFEITLEKAISYKVNFKLWKQISTLNSFLQRPFKREEIADEDIPEYFWRSDTDPFSSEEKASWSPYDYGDSLFLEDSYQKFINGVGPAIVYLGTKYQIDFKNWIQFQKSKANKQRPIMRGRSEKIKFIVRKERWDCVELCQKDNYFNEKKIIANAESVELEKILKSKNKENKEKLRQILESKKKTLTFLWEVGNDKIELFLPSEMSFFINDTLFLSAEAYVKELIIEIKHLSLISEFQNKNNSYDYSDCLEKLQANPSSLFIQLAKIYIREGFLYKELNKLLRCAENKANQGFKIKYFYVGLMAALNKLSEETKTYLKEELSINNDKVYKVYRGSAISEEEVRYYKNHQNILRQINCFLSTSIKKDVAEGFLEHPSNQGIPLKAIYEYELSPTKNPPFTFLGINALDKYGEKEVLIHSGAIIQITSLSETFKNQFYIKGKIISSGWKNYFQNLILSYNSKLDLSGNGFGLSQAKENMELLKEALIENKSITSLNLWDNGFGTGAKENMLLLLEALVENKSITSLNLNANGFGKAAAKENMQLFKDVLINNKSITSLDLGFNGFGKATAKENMQLLKEALIENKSIKCLDLSGNGFSQEDKFNLKNMFGEKIKIIF